ncbi:sarcosine oxidase subunit delta [Azorhizobium oxalatiphilum]|uniref:Sarcosine oxidase subunit delta n=1 Tax=Azorhizobium oxalatiphilum TaxID=980631 RepID=A0A917F5M0_9HYPH|nr:sarcosine oxidase subunit delta [Azorhizobium oxalatiphilum]GGF50473.1 sarcosine oxidase subunit delta [Azorhizobium oxalatiphilum]
MKIMNCPFNGPRNSSEFTCFGPVRPPIDPDTADDAAWSRHMFQLDNTPGVIREWWRHTPSNYFFIAERNTVTDEIVATYEPAALHGKAITPKEITPKEIMP